MDSNGIVTEDDFLVNSCSDAMAISSASICVSQLYVGGKSEKKCGALIHFQFCN